MSRAYEILSDATKRQIYDQQGEDEVERYEQYSTRTQYLIIYLVGVATVDRKAQQTN
jgi:DnaJ-class molecular chaperone